MNKNNNYVVSNYRERLTNEINAYGVNELYEELKYFKNDNAKSIDEETEERHRRSFVISIKNIEKGKGLLNNIEDFAFVLDKIGLDFHKLMTDNDGKQKEKVNKHLGRIENVISEFSTNLNRVNLKQEATKSEKIIKKRNLNEKRFNDSFLISSYINDFIDNFTYVSFIELEDHNNKGFGDTKLDHTKRYNSGFLASDFIFDEFRSLYSLILNDMKIRRKLKNKKYRYVLKAIELRERFNKRLTPTRTSFSNYKDFNINFTRNNDINLDEVISIYLFILSFYTFSIQDILNLLENKKDVDEKVVNANICSLNEISNDLENLIDRIKDYEMQNDINTESEAFQYFSKLFIMISSLANFKIHIENRYCDNLNINSLLSWITMVTPSISKITFKQYDTDIIACLKELFTNIEGLYSKKRLLPSIISRISKDSRGLKSRGRYDSENLTINNYMEMPPDIMLQKISESKY